MPTPPMTWKVSLEIRKCHAFLGSSFSTVKFLSDMIYPLRFFNAVIPWRSSAWIILHDLIDDVFYAAHSGSRSFVEASAIHWSACALARSAGPWKSPGATFFASNPQGNPRHALSCILYFPSCHPWDRNSAIAFANCCLNTWNLGHNANLQLI